MSEFLSDDMDAITNEIATLAEQRDELLTALKELLKESVEFMDDGGEWNGYRTKGMKAAKKAINKAEGKGE